jgi:hypothetical protein
MNQTIQATKHILTYHAYKCMMHILMLDRTKITHTDYDEPCFIHNIYPNPHLP